MKSKYFFVSFWAMLLSCCIFFSCRMLHSISRAIFPKTTRVEYIVDSVSVRLPICNVLVDSCFTNALDTILSYRLHPCFGVNEMKDKCSMYIQAEFCVFDVDSFYLIVNSSYNRLKYIPSSKWDDPNPQPKSEFLQGGLYYRGVFVAVYYKDCSASAPIDGNTEGLCLDSSLSEMKEESCLVEVTQDSLSEFLYGLRKKTLPESDNWVVVGDRFSVYYKALYAHRTLQKDTLWFRLFSSNFSEVDSVDCFWSEIY